MLGSAILILAVASRSAGLLRDVFDLRSIGELVKGRTASLPETHYSRFNAHSLLRIGSCASRDPGTPRFDPKLLGRWEESVREGKDRELREIRGCEFDFSECVHHAGEGYFALYTHALVIDWSELCRTPIGPVAEPTVPPDTRV